MIGRGSTTALMLCFAIALPTLSGCRTLASSADTQPSPERRRQAPTTSALQSTDLLPADRLRGNFVLQQTVTVRWRVDGEAFEESFSAALQRQGETLLILGLGPMGQVGFELRLDDEGVRFENRMDRVLPFQPENILADVQRVFYPWIDNAAGCTQCTREGLRQGIAILEKYGPNGLVERRFSAADDLEQGEIVVRYGEDRLTQQIPARADLRNDWFGYSLVIETHRFDPIESPDRAQP